MIGSGELFEAADADDEGSEREWQRVESTVSGGMGMMKALGDIRGLFVCADCVSGAGN